MLQQLILISGVNVVIATNVVMATHVDTLQNKFEI